MVGVKVSNIGDVISIGIKICFFYLDIVEYLKYKFILWIIRLK